MSPYYNIIHQFQGGEGHRRDRRFTVYKVGLVFACRIWTFGYLDCLPYLDIWLDLERECLMDDKYQHFTSNEQMFSKDFEPNTF